MNKKFLSVVVFGALLASSAGTFTSCKDYDDDIDAVNGRIDELAKSLSDLQAKVGSFVKSGYGKIDCGRWREQQCVLYYRTEFADLFN